MEIIDVVCVLLLLISGLVFMVGTLGLLRFPDVYTRLHALTKADNVGLGFIILALLLQADSLLVAGKIMLIWVLVLISGASVGHLIARRALRRGVPIWKQ